MQSSLMLQPGSLMTAVEDEDEDDDDLLITGSSSKDWTRYRLVWHCLAWRYLLQPSTQFDDLYVLCAVEILGWRLWRNSLVYWREWTRLHTGLQPKSQLHLDDAKSRDWSCCLMNWPVLNANQVIYNISRFDSNWASKLSKLLHILSIALPRKIVTLPIHLYLHIIPDSPVDLQLSNLNSRLHTPCHKASVCLSIICLYEFDLD